MASVNQVNILGRLGKDPELRYTQSQIPVCEFPLATDGPNKTTDWHRVQVWEKQAENAAKYLSKGRQAHVSGRLKYEKYTDKEGIERYVTKIVAGSVQFLDGGEKQQQDEVKKSLPAEEPVASTDDMLEAIPF